ncbi:type I restriction enzyme R subunit [Volucribacter psittacicida]|uniref:Type I restriction enzyme endonuclease subunit n=1 Tax=Volucribacter psittacicida TaxID=203482 RepID=A0A4R1FUU0_9PAST|nr:HsdR family type I site-specific deoxyribonuclease [Volucribacter psittacicida]TCJ98687.1 type I restriction enzyme R subunit [Volucribacter psittacicida]
MTEFEFETQLISYLSTGKIATNSVAEPTPSYFLTEQLWEYKSEIKTTEQLWQNFKQILERLNQNILHHPLSVHEFEQVKTQICNLRTPYQAGQFLYGLNGISQVAVDLEDGRHVFLTVFDQKQIGAGDTVYQIVNQIERPATIAGKQNRRFDITLLINGLPIIQIEAKKDTVDVNDALNQMHQYALENQYRDIFSTVQILVAVAPNNVKYMANTTADKFNKDFAFNWQRKNDNTVVRHWKEFANSMLSIPMAHQMATNYMILDGTKNKQMLKVMRPYQVYATQAVLDKLKPWDFEFSNKKLGYIWHTTGSGKTITSFKTAWLASRLPNVDKVVFVVDRIALTKQTFENYQAYDPDNNEDNWGSVQNTNNTRDLRKKLKEKSNNIIVTSVQKLLKLVKSKGFVAPDKRIVFVVDEAHRSTAGEGFELIQAAFKKSVWIGYTGTPMFDNTTKGLRTEDIFGELLHAYTIREAIADRNVLGFKVDFKSTVDMRALLKQEQPDWNDEKIEQELEAIRQEEFEQADLFGKSEGNRKISKGEKIERSLHPNFYDETPEHVEKVVEDIFQNWRNRSNDGKYNALLTTHVSGGGASTPLAMRYFDEFVRVNKVRSELGKFTLKVAITFSLNTSNNNSMTQSNQALHRAIDHYNQQFNTKFGLDSVSEYTQDVMSRLNKTCVDKNYLDLVIVVDQLLTGFDAPELNTLYVDRILKGAGLIQAYSRTNRIADMQEKPFGQIINYRWPVQNERLMNEALAIYANKNSAHLSDEERKRTNQKDGILAKPFNEVLAETKKIVETLAELSKNSEQEPFMELPKSENQKETFLEELRQYNIHIAKLKQYSPEQIGEYIEGFDYDNPDALIEQLGMTEAQERNLTTVLAGELKQHLAKIKHIPVAEIELRMSHVKDVRVNYDYLTELLEQLINQVHQQQSEQVAQTKANIEQFANGLEDLAYAQKIRQATQAIINKEYPTEPFEGNYRLKDGELNQVLEQASTITLDRQLLDFRNHWGITDIVSSAGLRQLFAHHQYGQQDLDDTKAVTKIINQGVEHYQVLATDSEVQALSKIKYRTALRNAIGQLADKLTQY